MTTQASEQVSEQTGTQAQAQTASADRPVGRSLRDVFSEEEPQSILLYGAAKSGKTQAVAEIVKAGYNAVWLDCERGIRTLKQTLTEAEQERIIYVRVPDTNTNPVAIATVGKLFAARSPQRICYNHGVVGCGHPECKSPSSFYVFDPSKLDSTWVVVVDSLTQVSESALAHATKDIQAALLTNHAKADWDAYAYQGQLLKALLSNMQQSNFHRVFITHEEVIEQADGSELIFPVCGTRQFSRSVARYFDHICYLYRQNNKHCRASSTTFKATVMSGSRSGLAVEGGASLVDLLRGTPAAEVQARVAAAKAAVDGAKAVAGQVAQPAKPMGMAGALAALGKK